MALANFLLPGTYSKVANITYDKDNRFFQFVVEVYKDVRRLTKVCEVVYQFVGHEQGMNALTKSLTSPPDDLSWHDEFLVPPGATGEWEGHDYTYAIWTDAWNFSSLNAGYVVYVIDEDKYYYVKGETEEIEEVDYFTSKEFDEMFDVDNMSDQNVMEFIYNFLKTKPEFSGVEDC